MAQEPLDSTAPAVDIAGASHSGLVPTSNEDAYIILGGETLPSWCSAVAGVFDGVGGRANGGQASSRAARYLRELLIAPSLRSGPPGPLGNLVSNLLRALHHMLKTDGLVEPALHSMATTATIAMLVRASPGTLWLGHVGDSPAFRLRDGQISKLVAEDSLVGGLLRDGLITAQQAMDHPRRHVITQALGYGVEVTPHVAAHQVAPGDRVLLCTDGLTNMVPAERIREIVAAQPPETACGKLIDAANAAGGWDNITVVALSFNAQ
jgi:protein phosphatase